MAGIRDHGELGFANELDRLNGVFKPNKIVITKHDENRNFY